MEKSDTPLVLHGIADRMRLQATETFQLNYRDMLNRAANSLDTEADRLTEMRIHDCCMEVLRLIAARAMPLAQTGNAC
jgi:hypothetical protein